MIMIRKPDQKIRRDRPRSFFITAIDFPLTAEEIGDLLLRQIMVNS